MTEVDAFVILAERMAEAVRPVVMGYFRAGVEIDEKADTTPVTAADREAEATMRRMIGEACPDHGVLGEEYGADRADAAFVWVLDPIDGTKSFVTGKPLFGTLIALVREETPIVGLIDMPALDERWVGVDARLTIFNGQPARVRPCSKLGQAWLYASSPHMFPEGDFEAFERLRLRCRAGIYGADCYAYGLLASGTVDLVCEATTKPHDYCALVPVIAGAGGMITDWLGRPLGLQSDGRVLAAGDERMHAAAREALGG